VDLLADDYPRLVALSHPRLFPRSDLRAIRAYSQQNVDVIDLEANEFRSMPVREIMDPHYLPLRHIAQIERDGYLGSILTTMIEPERMVITFDGLLARTDFAANIRDALQLLETHYGSPVDTEFTVEITEAFSQKPEVQVTLLQCRPQSHIQDFSEVSLPRDLPEKDTIFVTQRMIPQGVVQNIRYIMFVTPEGYFNMSTPGERTLLEHCISQLNAALKDETFVAVGPGRWGTSTPDLGVHVAYSDIYNARALIELAGEAVGGSLEPSFGTHFFQDLMEADIYPLAIFLDDEGTAFNRNFFYTTANRLLDFISADERILLTLRLIAVKDFRPGYHLDLVMDSQKSRATAYLVPDIA
jgi:hypothetical protein